VEEVQVTNEVFAGDPTLTNQHFKNVGLALGLVRVKELHQGLIEDLKEKVNPDETTQPNTTISSDY
jgi:hypothetical protein